MMCKKKNYNEDIKTKSVIIILMKDQQGDNQSVEIWHKSMHFI